MNKPRLCKVSWIRTQNRFRQNVHPRRLPDGRPLVRVRARGQLGQHQDGDQRVRRIPEAQRFDRTG